MKKLSERKKTEKTFAYCGVCEEYFEDDIIVHGNILCPNNCGHVVLRGITKEALNNKEDHNKESTVNLLLTAFR